MYGCVTRHTIIRWQDEELQSCASIQLTIKRNTINHCGSAGKILQLARVSRFCDGSDNGHLLAVDFLGIPGTRATGVEPQLRKDRLRETIQILVRDVPQIRYQSRAVTRQSARERSGTKLRTIHSACSCLACPSGQTRPSRALRRRSIPRAWSPRSEAGSESCASARTARHHHARNSCR